MGWYGLAAAAAVFVGIEPLARAARLFFPVGMLVLFAILAALYDRFDVHNLAPWLGSGLPVAKAGLGTTGIFLATFILPILAPAFQNLRTMKQAALLGVVLATAVRSLTLFVYTGVFSVAVGKEKVLPFFELARLVYISRFVQRIESFFIGIWVFAGMTMIAINLFLAAYLLARLFSLPSQRPLCWPLAIVAIQAALLIPDLATAVEISFAFEGSVQTVGTYVIPAVLLAALRLKGKGVTARGR